MIIFSIQGAYRLVGVEETSQCKDHQDKGKSMQANFVIECNWDDVIGINILADGVEHFVLGDGKTTRGNQIHIEIDE